MAKAYIHVEWAARGRPAGPPKPSFETRSAHGMALRQGETTASEKIFGFHSTLLFSWFCRVFLVPGAAFVLQSFSVLGLVRCCFVCRRGSRVLVALREALSLSFAFFGKGKLRPLKNLLFSQDFAFLMVLPCLLGPRIWSLKGSPKHTCVSLALALYLIVV